MNDLERMNEQKNKSMNEWMNKIILSNLIYKIYKVPYLRLTYSKAQQPKTVSLKHKRMNEWIKEWMNQ